MNWQGIRNITPMQAGLFLALLIVVFLPNYGIRKYGPSPAVPALLLCFLGMWWVFRERLALWRDTAQRRWLVVFLLLWVPVAISVPESLDKRESLSILGVLLLYFFTGAALLRALRTPEARTWLIAWVGFVLLFWLADGLVQFFFGSDFFGVNLSKKGRILGPFRGNTHFAVLLAILLPLLVHYFLGRRPWMAILAFSVGAVVAILVGSRAVMVYLAISGTGLFLRLPGARAKWMVVVAVVVVAVTAWVSSPVLRERAERLEALSAPTFESMDKLMSGRVSIWSNAMRMTADRPLTGVGAGAYQEAYAQYADPETDRFLKKNRRAFHAHQLYFGVAAETGLTGLAALAAIFVLAVVWVRKATPAQRLQAWPFSMGLLVYAFPINSQPPLYTQWLFPVLVLLLCGLLAALDDPADTSTASRV